MGADFVPLALLLPLLSDLSPDADPRPPLDPLPGFSLLLFFPCADFPTPEDLFDDASISAVAASMESASCALGEFPNNSGTSMGGVDPKKFVKFPLALMSRPRFPKLLSALLDEAVRREHRRGER